MTYRYVSKKTVRPARSLCDQLFAGMKGRLQERYGLRIRVETVGSGSVNLVTRKDGQPFDLDYDILIFGSTMVPEQIKHRLMSELDTKAIRLGFRNGQDSTSAITYIHPEVKDYCIPKFHVDIGIILISDQHSGRLIHHKDTNTYVWETPVHYDDLAGRAAAIRRSGLQNRLREVYLDRKNHYLDIGDPYHPSYIVYVEAVNQVWQQMQSQGGTNMSKGKVSGKTHTQEQMDHHANQGNPNNAAHKAALDNRSNQLNPNHAASKGGKK